jgi:hypothetical protein
MTLNIDALLEMYARAVPREDLGHRGASLGQRKLDEDPFVPRAGRPGPRVGSASRAKRTVESDDRLILTEQQYFDVVANANGFVNYTMLHLHREYRFLFIGLSMRDPNLRRALHLSFSERMRELVAEGETEHFAIGQSWRDATLNSTPRPPRCWRS